MATESTESTDPRSPTLNVVFLPPPSQEGVGVKGKKVGGLGWGPWIPWIPWLIWGGADGSAAKPGNSANENEPRHKTGLISRMQRCRTVSTSRQQRRQVGRYRADLLPRQSEVRHHRRRTVKGGVRHLLHDELHTLALDDVVQ